MSNIYVTEPNTEGKVLLHTSFGDIDVELWPQQAPKACRNFVQLCVDGYYDNTIFHRIIAGFMIQGGDPTGTGNGGESSYGEAFFDEFHQRLRFNHRGILAMANENKPNSNHSQFFFTLDACEFLNRKHTIFGKVTGNTIFNLLSVGDMETDSSERPLNPPKLLSAEVLWNPFDDIVPRALASRKATEGADDAKKKRKKDRKATKDMKLLSFGDEEEEFQQAVAKKKKTIVSSHDLLDDKKLKAEVNQTLVERIAQASNVTAGGDAVKEAKKKDTLASLKAAIAANESERKDAGAPEPQTAENGDLEEMEATKKEKKHKKRKADEATDEYTQLREELRHFRKAVPLLRGDKAKHLEQEKAQKDLLTPLQQQRQKYLQRKRETSRVNRQQSTIEKLNAFREKLHKAKHEAPKVDEDQKESYHGQILEDEEEQTAAEKMDSSWMTTKLKFKKHIDDQFRAGFDPSTDDYMTIDSRTEKSHRHDRRNDRERQSERPRHDERR
ncbi:TPA: hypothetical protein N0F65_002496 [Lagenidium giganteum]|uniref:PPIase cyclophilin-type domain-containing protein n=1 Tax=Lagenidium giganteum TaxID=4803 RepID=A0AAV2YVV8_9STRA|nr:TPA: hypothetical protein N0F65_002496 [Lagenidium giganteum]